MLSGAINISNESQSCPPPEEVITEYRDKIVEMREQGWNYFSPLLSREGFWYCTFYASTDSPSEITAAINYAKSNGWIEVAYPSGGLMGIPPWGWGIIGTVALIAVIGISRRK